jgi:hypothetical protein
VHFDFSGQLGQSLDLLVGRSQHMLLVSCELPYFARELGELLPEMSHLR